MDNLEQRLREDLKQAHDEYQQALADANDAQERMDKLDDKILYIKSLLKDETEDPFVEAQATTERVVARGKYAGMTTAATIEAILRDRPGAMRIKKIVDSAIAGGFGGSEPDMKKIYGNISSILSKATKNKNHPIFRKVSRGKFAIKQAH